MESIRKWLYKPKKDDKSLLAQFFYADEDLNILAHELDSFDGRQAPERCTALVNQLRQAQDKVVSITSAIMDALIGDERAPRNFRVKFPEDVLQDNLAGQLWFGAECLAAGSSIMNRETESAAMRPLAKAVTKSLENVRNLLRDACLRNNTPNGPIKLDSNELFTEMLLESLKIFDRLFAEFELAYVSAMVPVKSTQEYELQELIGVLFSETLQRALKMKLLTQEMVDDCDPALMFTIPRLAIVSGLLIFSNGPLCIDEPVEKMSEMFRPFRTLLHKIRELLWILDKHELYMLEKLLCDNEQLDDVKSVSSLNVNMDNSDFYDKFYGDVPCFAYRGATEPKSDYHEGPSTSGCSETPPEHDFMQVISAAAATLSSILVTSVADAHNRTLKNLESPDDSGICTETTSLDRSPSLELNDSRSCATCCQKQERRKFQKGSLAVRKKGNVESSSSSGSETSSFNSNCVDDEEIAFALQAPQLASREELRAKYRSSEDLIHRLFVCVAGVADQLQTNFACDLRNILKSVFLMNASDATEAPPKPLEPPCLESSIEYHPTEDEVVENNEFSVDPNILAQEALFDTDVYFHLEEDGCSVSDYTNHPRQYQIDDRSLNSLSSDFSRYASLREDVANLDSLGVVATNQTPSDPVERPPVWIPDVEAPQCMSCGLNFTVMKRRHHCRNCGKVFCARCSANSVPLPKYGLVKPVRVCNKCFIYNLTPFTIQ